MLRAISNSAILAIKSPARAIAHVAALATGLRRVLKQVSEGRSPKWYAIAKKWKKNHPSCANCGKTTNVIVHHKIPFHIDPSRELDLTNLITLCESKTLNCHLWQGHNGNFQSYNSSVALDSSEMLVRLKNRPIIPFSPEN